MHIRNGAQNEKHLNNLHQTILSLFLSLPEVRLRISMQDLALNLIHVTRLLRLDLGNNKDDSVYTVARDNFGGGARYREPGARTDAFGGCDGCLFAQAEGGGRSNCWCGVRLVLGNRSCFWVGF